MKSITLFSAAILLCTSSIAQDSIAANQTQKGKPYSLHVFKTDGSVQKGYLYGANADGITLTMNTKQSNALTQLSAEQIDKLYLRRKGNVGKGLLIGSLAGIGIGMLVGVLMTPKEDSNDDYYSIELVDRREAVIGFGTIGLLTGGGIGLGIGASSKKKYYIRGKKENYTANYQAIVERAMVQQE